MIHYNAFQHSNILITGGTKGVGLSIVHQFIATNNHEKEAKLYIISRSPSNFYKIHPNVVLALNIFFIMGDVNTFLFPTIQIDFMIHTLCFGSEHLIELAKINPVQMFWHYFPIETPQPFQTEYLGE